MVLIFFTRGAFSFRTAELSHDLNIYSKHERVTLMKTLHLAKVT